jgi:hypothetical protein
MSGAIDKKILEVREELDSSPTTHLSARTGILDSVTLSREFAQTRLNALCEKLTSVIFSLYIQLEDQAAGNNLLLEDANEILMEASTFDASYTLSQVCENLARNLIFLPMKPSMEHFNLQNQILLLWELRLLILAKHLLSI